MWLVFEPLRYIIVAFESYVGGGGGVYNAIFLRVMYIYVGGGVYNVAFLRVICGGGGVYIM